MSGVKRRKDSEEMASFKSDSSSSEVSPLNSANPYIKYAFKKTKIQLQLLKKRRKLLQCQELLKKEEIRLLEKMLSQRAQQEEATVTSTPHPLPPPRPKNVNRKVTYELQQEQLDVQITIYDTKKQPYYLTIKHLMAEMYPFIIEYEDIIPLELLKYAATCLLETRIKKIFDDTEIKIKHKELTDKYRHLYPFYDYEKLLKTALQAIRSGYFNDPAQTEGAAQTDPDKEVFCHREFTDMGHWNIYTIYTKKSKKPNIVKKEGEPEADVKEGETNEANNVEQVGEPNLEEKNVIEERGDNDFDEAEIADEETSMHQSGGWFQYSGYPSFSYRET